MFVENQVVAVAYVYFFTFIHFIPLGYVSFIMTGPCWVFVVVCLFYYGSTPQFASTVIPPALLFLLIIASAVWVLCASI
jgi:hypothetical protein